MIQASNDFVTYVTKTSRQFKATLLCNGSELSCDIASFTIHKGASGDKVLPGAVYVPYIEAAVRNCSTSVEGKTIIPYINVAIGRDQYGAAVYASDGSGKGIQLGSFVATKPTTTTDTLTFKAVGKLGIVGGVIYTSALTYPAALADVISEVATQLDMTITLNGLSAANKTLEKSMSGILLREALAYIAMILGGFATEDYQGNVVISKFGYGSSLTVEQWRSQRWPEFAESDWECTGVKVVVTEDAEDEEGNIIPGISYSHGTPNVSLENPYITEDLFGDMWPEIEGYELSPCEIDMSMGDPRLEPWDNLSITVDSVTHTVPCLTLVHNFDGGFTTSVDATVTTDTEESAEVSGPVTKGLMQAISDAEAAQTAAAGAIASAASADAAAQNALTSAADATTAAVEAQAEAGRAKEDAKTASESAQSAASSASSALRQLSEVEKVMDVLTWVSQHGIYEVSGDTEVIGGKYYFSVSSAEMTQDSTLSKTKAYYTRSGTSPDYVYTYVEEPDVQYIRTYYEVKFAVELEPNGNPSEQGYYELASVNEAVSNYVSSHLALTDDGLFIQTDGKGTKIQIASDAIHIYNELGTIIATYSDSITLGDASGTHISLSAVNGLGFYQGTEDPTAPNVNRVAYIDENKLYITQAEIKTNLQIGAFLWKVHPYDANEPTKKRISLIFSP